MNANEQKQQNRSALKLSFKGYFIILLGAFVSFINSYNEGEHGNIALFIISRLICVVGLVIAFVGIIKHNINFWKNIGRKE